jgi:hypothetical protein
MLEIDYFSSIESNQKTNYEEDRGLAVYYLLFYL